MFQLTSQYSCITNASCCRSLGSGSSAFCSWKATIAIDTGVHVSFRLYIASFMLSSQSSFFILTLYINSFLLLTCGAVIIASHIHIFIVKYFYKLNFHINHQVLFLSHLQTIHIFHWLSHNSLDT